MLPMKKLLILFICSILHCETISVIIPCYDGHFHLLDELITAYENQTRPPDEIVVSLSSAHNVPNIELDKLNAKHNRIPLQIITTNQACPPGRNRNIASALARGEIFVYNDADDLPHPQRLELIEYFFETRDVMCLLHRWSFEKHSDHYKAQHVPSQFMRWWSKHDFYSNLHFGAPAIRKKAWETINWPNNFFGDPIYNELLYRKFKRTLLIDAYLYVYRNEHTSNHGQFTH